MARALSAGVGAAGMKATSLVRRKGEVMKSLSLFALLLIPSAHADTRQDAKVVMDSDAEEAKYQAEWGYASAIRVGDTIYLSGVVAGVRKGETDLTLGYERAFKKIGETLRSAGASWDDVIDITTFHTDLTTQMPAIIAVKNRYIKAPFPAWTAIQVARLIPTNGITEIKIVAKVSR
jgi:enamine deaminase RidA (YjgF/YER057c/UK114 family)